jgi:hypothetical protein
MHEAQIIEDGWLGFHRHVAERRADQRRFSIAGRNVLFQPEEFGGWDYVIFCAVEEQDWYVQGLEVSVGRDSGYLGLVACDGGADLASQGVNVVVVEQLHFLAGGGA